MKDRLARWRVRRSELLLSLLFLGCIGYGGHLGWGYVTYAVYGPPPFDGERALAHVQAQVDLGPRPTGSLANRRTRVLIRQHLEALGWQVYAHPFPLPNGDRGENLLAWKGSGPDLLLGAHFDTRLFADEDPDPALRTRPVTGANDGASGVAVLMELARALETDKTGHRICLAFFDAEDNGNIPEWHWILGSSAFAADLDRLPACNAPTAVVIVDMVGDSRQELPLERTSTPELQAAIWQQAAELGLDAWFQPVQGYAILDDHHPFLNAGIPAVDIIDFDYPWWHTVGDTMDKVSADSLWRVGTVLETWLEAGAEWR